MKTLLILGAGIEQAYAISLAKQKGIRTVVLDMNPAAPGAALADEFYPMNERWSPEVVRAFLAGYEKKIDGVMTIASDIPHCVSAAGEALGVPHIPLEVALRCVEKAVMKDTLSAHDVNVPAYARVASVGELTAFIERVGYPVVIKPVDNAGARGVLRLTGAQDLEESFAIAKGFSRSGHVIAEQFVTGLQVSTEGIMHDGIFHTTGLADRNYARLETTAPYMVEDGGEVPSALTGAALAAVIDEFEKAVRALGIDWGPAKGDMIYGADGKAYVIEIAARLSGGNFCYDKVPWATGVDIVDILIDMSVGNAVDASRFAPTKHLWSVQRYFYPAPGVVESIDGVEAAAQMPFIKKIDIWVKQGDTVASAENHPSRVGYVISLAPTREEAITAAEEAVRAVTFNTIAS